RAILVENPSTRSFVVPQIRPTRGQHRQVGKGSVSRSLQAGADGDALTTFPSIGPDPSTVLPDPHAARLATISTIATPLETNVPLRLVNMPFPLQLSLVIL
ncbi:hypothetical protein, partial [Streptomyces bacillaris]|uniref:hypothetical protein n=1 Tax=Streptomyces bacillaris TaxID=68179 RepID=UPI003464FD09